jgi:hypothetical protein
MSQICFWGIYFSVICTNLFSQSKSVFLFPNKWKTYLCPYVKLLEIGVAEKLEQNIVAPMCPN